MKKSILFLALLQSLLIFAQAPQKMSYQSVVRNAANQIVANQSIGVKISIIEGSLNGTTAYAERHTTTTNANGLFTLETGGGTPTTGTFATINWGNGSHYIKSEIDLTGGTNYTLSGTMELLSVPYALYATNGISPAQAGAISANTNSITTERNARLSAIMEQATTNAFLQAQIDSDIKDNAVTSAKILDANVTNAKLDKSNIPLSGFGSAEADVALGGYKLTGVLDPTDNQDAATKKYVDDTTLTKDLTSTHIFVGDYWGKVADVALSGDATIDSWGALTIANDAVTNAKMADDAVDTSKIIDNAVTNAKLAVDAVDTSKIKDNAVTNAKLDKNNIPLSGFGAAIADVDLGANKLTNVADPTLAQDVATKKYVDDTMQAQIATQAATITAQAAAIAAMQAQISVLQKPRLITSPIENLKAASATSGGAITSKGLGDVTATGLVWSTLTNPTIDLTTKTFDGTGSGEFGSNITGLTPETTYYVRAYATSSYGTAYGNEVIFTTLTTPVTPAEVTIGTQTWTGKNLDVATYSDGTVIPQVTDPTEWANLTTGAWCYYNNDATKGTTYGKLYNWYAAAGIWNEASKTDASQRKKLAPTGYHVPSDAEWTTLTDYLGGAGVAGGKMKESGTTHWYSPNQDATNTSGFTGLPGGARMNDGKFYVIGYDCLWWSSSVDSTPTYAWIRALNHNSGPAIREYFNKTYGITVRCLRD